MLITIAAIVVIVILKRDDITPPPGDVAVPGFISQVSVAVNSRIVGANFSQAATAFDSIMSSVQTEMFTERISAEQAGTCRKEAFYAFFPIFDSYQQQYFKRRTWSQKEVAEIEQRCKNLQSFNIATQGAAQTLNNVLKVIADYNGALALISHAKICNSPAAALNIKSKVANYKHAPLTNNASLMGDLNNSFSIAKASVARNISAKVQQLSGDYFRYINYADFFKDKTNIENRIDEYVKAFGSDSQAQSWKNTIKVADNDALRFYSGH